MTGFQPRFFSYIPALATGNLLLPGDVKPLKRPPNWLRRPVGACFGFGGRLVSFVNHKQQLTDPMTGQVRAVETGAISISQVSQRLRAGQRWGAVAQVQRHNCTNTWHERPSACFQDRHHLHLSGLAAGRVCRWPGVPA